MKFNTPLIIFGVVLATVLIAFKTDSSNQVCPKNSEGEFDISSIASECKKDGIICCVIPAAAIFNGSKVTSAMTFLGATNK